MPHAIGPGDVLAGRYRLVDLLSESGDGRFWRARDRVLERHVALHVIAEDDPRAPGLIEAARSSATVLDHRILRVLDAERADGVCYVVNEWGSGTSLDIVAATHGPLTARQAAWLVAEVADSVAVGHAAGVTHGRLVPENVLVDRTGAVRIIGYAVDAALHGLPPGPPSRDLVDLAGLLYCGLTARWAGASASAVPPAPQEPDRVLRPRQVRAGVPRPLDQLCDELLNAPGGARSRDRRPESATALVEVLTEFVGDPTGLPEQLAAKNVRPGETVVLPQVPEVLPRDRDEPTQVVAHPEPTEALPAPEAAAPEVPAAPARRDAEPTQAGLPIFDDDNDDVSWLTARSTPPPPPPPFEEPPERPLFAPEPADGSPPRRPRDGASTRLAEHGSGFWPWDGTSHGKAHTQTGHQTGHGTGAVAAVPLLDHHDDDPHGPDGAVPGRSWLRVAVGLTLAIVLVVAVVVAVNLGNGRSLLGQQPDDPTSSTTPAEAEPAPRPLRLASATDLDPQGGGGGENPETAPLAVDGDPATTWTTERYFDQLGPAGLKTGVGLVVDLGRIREVADVELQLVGSPTNVALYVSDQPPSDVADLQPVASRSVPERGRLALEEPVRGRYLTLWLTGLPAVDGGYRGEVAEVRVLG